MKIIYNSLIPFKGFLAVNLFGVLFVRESRGDVTPQVLNHEAIHTAQMRELGYLFFYVIYLAEWLFRLTRKGDAYRNISFEREAYANENDPDYLRKRRKWAMWLQTR